MLKNLGDLEFDLSRSLKVKCKRVIGFPIPVYVFLFMFNSNIGHNYTTLRDISLQNRGDLDFDISRSLKVKSNGGVGRPIYDFLLVPGTL